MQSKNNQNPMPKGMGSIKACEVIVITDGALTTSRVFIDDKDEQEVLKKASAYLRSKAYDIYPDIDSDELEACVEACIFSAKNYCDEDIDIIINWPLVIPSM